MSAGLDPAIRYLWAKGHDTADMAKMFDVPEAVVASRLAALHDQDHANREMNNADGVDLRQDQRANSLVAI